MDIKAKVASQTNVVIASAAVGMTVDGQAIYPYDTIFLAGQTTAAENGPYTMGPSGKLLPALASSDGSVTVEILGGTSTGNRYQYQQTAATGATAVFARADGTIASYSGTLTAGSSATTVATLSPAANTRTTYGVSCKMYDGATPPNKIIGPSELIVERIGTAAPTIVGSLTFGTVFATAGTGSGWNPEASISGNNVLLKLTPDANNDTKAKVTVTLIETIDISDAPAANPVPPLRAALHALAPAIELYADVGLTVTGDSPPHVTGWEDQSGNARNGVIAGTGIMQYVPDAGGKAAIHTPAIGTPAGWACGTITGTPHGMTIAWRATLGNAVGAAIEVIFGDGAHWLACNHTSGKITYNNGSTSYDLGNALAGKHNFVVVIDGTGTTATLYTDGVAGTPVTVGDVAWGGTGAFVSCLNGSGGFPLQSGSEQCFVIWYSATNAAARVAAFDALVDAAFGAHA